MTKNEQDKFIKSFKDYRKTVVSSRESAKRFMEESGIITKTGRLTAGYK
ncbi:MAG: hypothetical protein MI922_00085 [Bacteroidales bacterium]|nr:hypothetical protein [Bacteroidales bacterium]